MSVLDATATERIAHAREVTDVYRKGLHVFSMSYVRQHVKAISVCEHEIVGMVSTPRVNSEVVRLTCRTMAIGRGGTVGDNTTVSDGLTSCVPSHTSSIVWAGIKSRPVCKIPEVS